MSRARDLADLGGSANAGTVTGESLVINGDMAIAQRGTSETGLGNGNSGYHTIDRYRFTEGGTPTCEFTMSQSTTAPTGFSYSLKMECTTAQTTLASTDQLRIEQRIEAQNLQHLDYGTSSAKNVTLSFWVRSNLTGTYVVWFYLNDDARAASKTYTIDTADTWEYKTITLSGDQTGVIDNDNGNGLQLNWYLGAGDTYTTGTANTDWQASVTADRVAGQTVNMGSSTSNEWYLTGVKLEVGSTATPFKHESYGENLAKCQRYYYLHVSGFNIVSGADFYTTTQGDGNIEFPVTMRASPSIDANSGSSYWGIYVKGVLRASSAGWTIFRNSPRATSMYNQGFTGATAGDAGRLQGNNASAYMAFDAEL